MQIIERAIIHWNPDVIAVYLHLSPPQFQV